MYIRAIEVQGDHDEWYRIETRDENVVCTCNAFRFAPEDAKTCKHIAFAAKTIALR